MRPLTFQCPVTGRKVEALVDESLIGPNTICIPVECPLCQRPHLIDPKTGKSPTRED